MYISKKMPTDLNVQDIAEKSLLSYNDVFADIVNVLLFRGERIVVAEELGEAQTFSQYKEATGTIREQERDVAKYWKRGTFCLSMFGFENQTRRDDAMPLRVMCYDGAAYREQLHSKKCERYPVITLVLYFGTKREWNKPMSLKDSLSVDERLLPFFHDYGINVFNLAWLTDEQINSFQSDFRIVAEYLRAVRTGKTEDWTRQKIEYVSEIIDLLKVISDDEIFDDMADFIIEEQRKKGGVNVCEFVQKIKNEGRNEGIVLGRNEGIVLGRNEGIARGEKNVLSLISKLYAAGRGSDVERIANDYEYLKQVMHEFQK